MSIPMKATRWAENATDLIGTYTNLDFVSITENDQDDTGVIEDNDGPGTVDNLTYDVGSGTVVSALDSTIAASADILLGDGSTITVTVGLLQTAAGDVFVRDVGNGLDNLNIQSIEIVSIIDNDFGGSNTGNSIDNSMIVCLLEGTRVQTPSGLRPVEDIAPGSRVSTACGRSTPVTHVLRQTAGDRSAPPVCIPKDALAPGLPMRTMCVSQCHRILVRSRIVRRMFGVEEVFVPAKRLLALPGVTLDARGGQRRFFNLLCPEHAVLLAEGVPVESLYPGPQVLQNLSPAAAAALGEALEQIGHPAGLGYLKALPEPPGHAQKRMIMRHLRNNVPLVPTIETAHTAT